MHSAPIFSFAYLQFSTKRGHSHAPFHVVLNFRCKTSVGGIPRWVTCGEFPEGLQIAWLHRIASLSISHTHTHTRYVWLCLRLFYFIPAIFLVRSPHPLS
uniref:Uncharacterized protein n=1 Tax=Trypanosoma vivax (strain Y486) TaxID=1055687 RepID=G0U9H8_TRYVY|nr:hypothetical protein TVY486_1117480 [Trypanosoma vivax Y486]